jgi:hypothetical protein
MVTAILVSTRLAIVSRLSTLREPRLKRSSRNSGIVKTLMRAYSGTNTQPRTRMSQACISQCAMAMPVANPAPASPTRCSEPMFEEKIEVPICTQLLSRLARK